MPRDKTIIGGSLPAFGIALGVMLGSGCLGPASWESAGAAAHASDAIFREGAVWTFEIEGWPSLPRGGGSAEVPDAVLHARRGGDESVHEGLEIAVGPLARAGRRPIRLRLPSEQRLGGMRTLRLDPMEGDDTAMRSFAAARLYAALGVPAPRVTHVVLSVDGESWGPYALVEHTGDVFYEDHFDGPAVTPYTLDAEGNLVTLEGEEAPRAEVFAERIGTEASEVGIYAVDMTMDRPALVSYLAAALALGSADGGWDSPSPILVDRGEPQPRLVPLPGGYGPLLVDPAADPGHPAGLLAFAERLLSIPALRTEIDVALGRVLECLKDDACLEDRVAKQERALRAALGGSGPASLVPVLSQRAETIKEFLDQERKLDAPDGDAHYLPFVQRGNRFEVRFRHLDPSRYAKSVALEIVSGADEPGPIPLRFDRAANWWSATVSLPLGPIEYVFDVTDEKGQPSVVRDPASSAHKGKHSVVDTRRIGVLEHLETFDVALPEPSGLSFVGDRLAVVSDSKKKIILVDPDDGSIEHEEHVQGEGLEGIAYDPVLRLYLVAEEATGNITWLDHDGRSVAYEDLPGAREGNSGLEALALRAEDGHIFVGKEKDPAIVWELAAGGEILWSERFEAARDLSGLDWGASDGVLYATSDEDRTLFRLGAHAEVTESWQIDVNKPEGVAVLGGRVWIASDEDGTIDVYSLDAWRFAD